MHFRRVICFFGCLIFGMSSVHAASLKGLKLHSESVILVDADTMKILYEKNAYQKYPPASITKVPVLVYALNRLKNPAGTFVKADQDCIGSITDEYSKKMKYNYPAHWLVLGGTHMSIHKQEVMKLEDLLFGMILVSANDAANIIAKHVGGTIPKFMGDINSYLKSIGCKNTNLKNPHGLHYPKHESCAYDMALVTSVGLKNPMFRKIFQTTQYQLPSTNKQKAKKLKTFNKLQKPGQPFYYPYAIGGKTGIHSHAKSTLVAAAKKNGKTLIVVLLKCPTRPQLYEDAIKLFEEGFKTLQ